ncbi:MAG: nicotinate phosphoribosyltransferase, partial [bacterium]|nr:nicotinate phosphoribosyltransferase [bacterium]
MIINSLLDTDLYKFTMQQVVLHRFPGADVEYAFKCRNEGIDLAKYIDEINTELDHLCTLAFTAEELNYLAAFRFFKKDFIDFLRIFRLSRDFITLRKNGTDLAVDIKGPWLHTILFEVPVLAIINEVYFRNVSPEPDYEKARELLNAKINIVKENSEILKFADFGTRRRRSGEWQQQVIGTLAAEVPGNLTGTSNVYFAKKYNLRPIGTMAHE